VDNATMSLQTVPLITAYDLLRDVTLIELAVIALLATIIGVLIFYLLREMLTRDITKKVTELVSAECKKITARANIHAGVNHWLGKMYDTALKLTQIAITEGEDLLDEQEIIMAKSNCGYYLAEIHRKKPCQHLRDKAIEYVQIGYDKYDQLVGKYNRPEWVDNYVFVKACFCESKREQKEILDLIEKLITREDLKEIRDYLKETKTYLEERSFPS
jgi:hypothetical protein